MTHQTTTDKIAKAAVFSLASLFWSLFLACPVLGFDTERTVPALSNRDGSTIKIEVTDSGRRMTATPVIVIPAEALANLEREIREAAAKGGGAIGSGKFSGILKALKIGVVETGITGGPQPGPAVGTGIASAAVPNAGTRENQAIR